MEEMKRLRWTRTIIVEGPEKWLEETRNWSALKEEGSWLGLPENYTVSCTESKIEEVKENGPAETDNRPSAK